MHTNCLVQFYSNKHRLVWSTGFVLLLGFPDVVRAEDTVEFKSGDKQTGKLISQDANFVVLEVAVGNRKITRKYPRKLVASVKLDGVDGAMPNPRENIATTPVETTGQIKSRSEREVLALIESVGRTPPDWYEATSLDYPKTLELAWPEKAEGSWNAEKNVGQYIWDRVNPNPSKWREGVKLLHLVMSEAKGDRDISNRAMRALGTMYHNLHQDYARAAFWWHQAGLHSNPSLGPGAAVHLADCYLKLGNPKMGLDLLKKMKSYPLDAIKLLGDLGQTDEALRIAELFAKQSNAVVSYLYAGEVCRVAGRLDNAENYYRKALSASANDTGNKEHARRNKQRAEASLAAIQFYKLSPKNVKDGVYKASSLGYEDQVQVEVTISAGQIESVRVTQHREKQFYSSITDTPRNIIARQSVVVDTTSGATITSDAIINATAKALAQGLN